MMKDETEKDVVNQNECCNIHVDKALRADPFWNSAQFGYHGNSSAFEDKNKTAFDKCETKGKLPRRQGNHMSGIAGKSSGCIGTACKKVETKHKVHQEINGLPNDVAKRSTNGWDNNIDYKRIKPKRKWPHAVKIVKIFTSNKIGNCDVDKRCTGEYGMVEGCKKHKTQGKMSSAVRLSTNDTAYQKAAENKWTHTIDMAPKKPITERKLQSTVQLINCSTIGNNSKSEEDAHRYSKGMSFKIFKHNRNHVPHFTSLMKNETKDKIAKKKAKTGSETGFNDIGFSSKKDSPAQQIDYFGKLLEDGDGDTPLHLAIIFLNLPAVLFLLDALSVDHINKQNNLYQTPLHLAVLTKQSIMVQWLIALGANPEIQDNQGRTPLHIACCENEIGLLKELFNFNIFSSLKPRFDSQHVFKIRDFEGFLCLHRAVMQGNIEAVDLLVRHGADVNVPDMKSGRSCLHIAVELADAKMVAYLLSLPQIDTWITTRSDETPWMLARGRLRNSERWQKVSLIADYKTIIKLFETLSPAASEQIFDSSEEKRITLT